jgi:hypothetical protein
MRNRKNRQWSAAEIMQVFKRFPREGSGPLAREMGRSEDAVCSQAYRLRLRSLTRRIRQGETRRLRGKNQVKLVGTDGAVGPALAFAH